MSEDQPPKEPLPYRSGFDDYAEQDRGLHVAAPIIGGMLSGIVLTCLTGGLLVGALGTQTPASGKPVAIAIGIMFLATAVLTFAGRSRQRKQKRYFLMGFLSGIAIISLVEGLCFFAISRG